MKALENNLYSKLFPAAMQMKRVNSSDAPKAIGPYSQAVDTGTLLFVSGQLGLDPKTGAFASEDAAEQTAQCLRNLEAILKTAGLGKGNVVKTTVFVTDLREFEKINNAYASFFGEERPARSTVQVAALPRGGKVEIEAVAAR
ncbi:MAG: RidA family protein [Methanomassiliicoccales archaeon]